MEPKESPSLEIGNQAIWSLSSCKPGFGVVQLRDGSTETYWQSDGAPPHLINIEFLKKVTVKRISVYVEYRQDESYTPSKIAIKAGSHFHDLAQVTTVELDEPESWVDIEVVDKEERPIKAFLFQIAILANHQNGRDTHIRLVKVIEPELSSHAHTTGLPQFESVDFRSMQLMR